MAIFSKLQKIHYSCYEIGHTWNPSCVGSWQDVFLSVFREALKIYGSVYLAAALWRKKGFSYFIRRLLPEVLRSTVFLSVNGACFVAFFCFWRKIAGFYFFYNTFLCGIPACVLSILIERYDRKWLGCFYFLNSAYLPAFYGALIAIVLERKSRRGLLAIYTTNLAVETAYRMAVSRGLAQPLRHGEVMLFSMATAVYLYLYKCKDGLPGESLSGINMFVGHSEQAGEMLTNGPDPELDVRSWARRPSAVTVSGKLARLLEDIKKLNKHAACRHQNSCFYYVFKGSARLFGAGFGVQAALKVLPTLPRVVRHPSTLLTGLLHSDNWRLGAFLSSFSIIFKMVNCILRWTRGKDSPVHGLVSGFLAGWSMLWYKSTTLALYTASRMLEMLYFKGIKAGSLPYVQFADIVIYSISTAFVFHAATVEPHNLRPAYWRFLQRVTGDRFGTMNRRLLDIFGVHSSKLFPDYWPNYDPSRSSLTPADIPS